MTQTPALDALLAEDVLRHLGVAPTPPSLEALDALLTAYTWRVPWESVSRIARRTRLLNTAQCPRWPEVFWSEALIQHTGGTCYESNYAFFSLLRYLGYEGYLTINNMHATIGCHSAIVIKLQDAHYMVDAGFPVHLPLLLNPEQPTERKTAFHTYRATPQENQQYVIERDKHPKPYCFTLINTPISDADYRQKITDDYGEKGLFLHTVIVTRVVDGRIWRFKGEVPYHLEQFVDNKIVYHYLGEDIYTVADKVAHKFGMDAGVVRAAMQITHPYFD